MGKLINAESLADLKARGISNPTEWQVGWNDAIDTIVEESPAVDAVGVVRCKDCKRAEFAEAGMTYCPEIIGSWVEDDWFCADGERREDG